MVFFQVKCPYSVKGKLTDEVGEAHCLKKDDAGVYRLDRSHECCYQILGQMAQSGLSWMDFVVFSERFMSVERISFCERIRFQ